MKRPKPRLLLPAVFVAAGCSPQQPQCDQSHRCWPDGGLICPSSCSTATSADGGIEYDSQGMPICLC